MRAVLMDQTTELEHLTNMLYGCSISDCCRPTHAKEPVWIELRDHARRSKVGAKEVASRFAHKNPMQAQSIIAWHLARVGHACPD